MSVLDPSDDDLLVRTAAPRRAGWRSLRAMPPTVVAALLGLVPVLLYLPSIVAEYGRADDYRSLYQSKTYSLQGAWDLGLAGGRPVSSVGWTFLISLSDSVSDLAWLRLLSLLAVATAGALVTAWGAALAGRRGADAWLASVLAGALLVAVPGAQTIVTWAVLAVQAWALPAALLAGILLDRWRPADRRLVYVTSGLLILASAFTYQQYVALALFAPVLGAALAFARGRRVDLRAPLFAAVAVGVSLVVNYAFVLAVGSNISDRVTQRQPWSETADWFFTVYLPRTIDLDVPDHTSSTVACIGILLVLLAVPLIRGVRYLCVSGAVVACWLAVAAPMAAVGELWASYRVVYPAQIVLWSGAALAAGWALTERRRDESRASTSASSLVLVGCVAVSLIAIGASRAYFYYAVPNGNDWRSAQCVADDLAPDMGPRDVLVLQPWSAARSRVILGDEPGIIAGAIDWAVGDMLWLAADDVGGEPRFDPARVPVIAPEGAHAPGRRYVTVAQDACESFAP